MSASKTPVTDAAEAEANALSEAQSTPGQLYIAACLAWHKHRDNSRALESSRSDLLEALKVAQRTVEMYVDPDAIRATSVVNAWHQTVECDALLRAAIARASEGKRFNLPPEVCDRMADLEADHSVSAGSASEGRVGG